MYLSNFKIDKEVTKCQVITEETIEVVKKKGQDHEIHQERVKEEDHKQVAVTVGLEKDQQQDLIMKELIPQDQTK